MKNVTLAPADARYLQGKSRSKPAWVVHVAHVASCHTGLSGARVALRTVLSAEPVASTNSLKGLKPRQLTSAACASTA